MGTPAGARDAPAARGARPGVGPRGARAGPSGEGGGQGGGCSSACWRNEACCGWLWWSFTVEGALNDGYRRLMGCCRRSLWKLWGWPCLEG